MSTKPKEVRTKIVLLAFIVGAIALANNKESNQPPVAEKYTIDHSQMFNGKRVTDIRVVDNIQRTGQFVTYDIQYKATMYDVATRSDKINEYWDVYKIDCKYKKFTSMQTPTTNCHQSKEYGGMEVCDSAVDIHKRLPRFNEWNDWESVHFDRPTESITQIYAKVCK